MLELSKWLKIQLLFDCNLQKARYKEAEVQQQKRYFAWQEQIHSLCSYADVWKYPVQLVLDAVNTIEEPAIHTHYDNNVTKLPVSLPITCPAAHLRSWKAQVQDRRLPHQHIDF